MTATDDQVAKQIFEAIVIWSFEWGFIHAAAQAEFKAQVKTRIKEIFSVYPQEYKIPSSRWFLGGIHKQPDVQKDVVSIVITVIELARMRRAVPATTHAPK